MAPTKTLDDLNWEYLQTKSCCLHFGGMGFQGTIPSEIGLLTELTEGLYFDHNSLTGSIPSQIGLLTNLKKSIQFQDNMLSVRSAGRFIAMSSAGEVGMGMG